MSQKKLIKTFFSMLYSNSFLPIFVLGVLILFIIHQNYESLGGLKFKYSNVADEKLLEIFDLDQQKFKYSNLSETELEYSFDYPRLLKSLNLSSPKFSFFGFPFVSSIFITRHIFRSFSDHHYVMDVNITVENVKCGDIIFVKIDLIQNFMNYYHPLIKYPYVLITTEGDYSAGGGEQFKYLKSYKIIRWFAQNTVARHPKLTPIPIGVVAPRGYNFQTMYDMAKDVIPYYNKPILLYLSFSPNTNPERRKTLKYFLNTFGDNPLVKIDQKRISWNEYLMNIKNAQFVLSPPGNGIDCHRTWEALYFGSVPIVIKNDLEPMYEGMPVMMVNDWTEVTEANLKKFQAKNLKTLEKDGLPLRPKIWVRYWMKEIIGTKLNYQKNYCPM